MRSERGTWQRADPRLRSLPPAGCIHSLLPLIFTVQDYLYIHLRHCLTTSDQHFLVVTRFSDLQSWPTSCSAARWSVCRLLIDIYDLGHYSRPCMVNMT